MNTVKHALRKDLKDKRNSLSYKRRQEASLALFQAICQNMFSDSCPILSFSSLKHEIDTTELNQFLAAHHNLLLPKVFKNTLKIYRVRDLCRQTEIGLFGELSPIADKCEEVLTPTIKTVLVPALGFCPNHHRIGYGKGFYDRFLSSLPPSCLTIGIGYHEQLIKTFPIDLTDFPLKAISLF